MPLSQELQQLERFVDLFELNGQPARLVDECLLFGDRPIPIRGGIPRFTPDVSYSSGNFSLLRQRHATLQLDSRNGTTDRHDTLLQRTRWSPHFLRKKLVLECGCGAGPDTEILRKFGATVVSVDLAGVDACRANVRDAGEGCIVQADITNLPFRHRSFDVVFCHRVLQHTPEPERTLDHILCFVRPGGAAFVHSYARTLQQMVSWKYALRPLTKRMDPEQLYRWIGRITPVIYPITEVLHRLPGGRRLVYQFIPIRSYAGLKKFEQMTREQLVEYSIHDTFDALSPRYDNPISACAMRRIAEKHLATPFEIVELPTITLLRSMNERAA
jgi:SAM-dependent methyltransferase